MPPPVLDVSRLYSRRKMNFDTGIDRVERAYLAQMKLVADAAYVVRNGSLYFLFDNTKIDDLLSSKSRIELLWLLLNAVKLGYRSVELPSGAHYFHTGHSYNHTKFWQRLTDNRIKKTIYIHDVIPLDYPEYMRPDSIAKFQSKFEDWLRYGDEILTNSQYSRSRIRHHMAVPINIKVAPLAPSLEQNWKTDGDNPSFITIGTIEPRKNHITLFRAWERLHEELGDNCPILHVVGKRGWANADVFNWLDTSPIVGKFVIEHGALTDDALNKLLCETQILLMASFVEGFGLPTIEATLSGRRVILSDIPIFRELFEETSGCFVAPDAVDEWVKAIKSPPRTVSQLRQGSFSENWETYFANNPIVL